MIKKHETRKELLSALKAKNTWKRNNSNKPEIIQKKQQFCIHAAWGTDSVLSELKTETRNIICLMGKKRTLKYKTGTTMGAVTSLQEITRTIPHHTVILINFQTCGEAT